VMEDLVKRLEAVARLAEAALKILGDFNCN
jgi:hypothetical protein